jgi:hypothetical protein
MNSCLKIKSAALWTQIWRSSKQYVWIQHTARLIFSSEFITLLAWSSVLNSSYCSFDLQFWILHTAHLTFRSKFIILFTWSSLKIKWDTRWTQIWRSSEIHDELRSEDQVIYTMNSDLKIKWDTRWTRVWRSSEIYDELPEFIVYLTWSSDPSSSYCALDLQIWVHRTVHLVVRVGSVTLFSWSSV